MKCHEPGPPLLFTMIMIAIVMPRTTSSDSSRFVGPETAVDGLVTVVAGEAASPGRVMCLLVDERDLAARALPSPYAQRRTFAKCGVTWFRAQSPSGALGGTAPFLPRPAAAHG